MAKEIDPQATSTLIRLPNGSCVSIPLSTAETGAPAVTG